MTSWFGRAIEKLGSSRALNKIFDLSKQVLLFILAAPENFGNHRFCGVSGLGAAVEPSLIWRATLIGKSTFWRVRERVQYHRQFGLATLQSPKRCWNLVAPTP
jgi:hypothetical protein